MTEQETQEFNSRTAEGEREMEGDEATDGDRGVGRNLTGVWRKAGRAHWVAGRNEEMWTETYI